MKIIKFIIFAVLFTWSGADAANYFVRADGMVLAANKANATSASSASTSLSMSSVNSATFAAGDNIYFSSVGGIFTTALTLPTGGSSDTSRVSYTGLEDGGYPVITNSSGTEGIQLAAKGNVNVSGFSIVASNATSGYAAISTYTSVVNTTISNISIDLTNATSTNVKGIYFSSAPLTNVKLDNVSVVMGVGAGKTYSIWSIGSSGNRGNGLTMNNVSLSGGTKATIQYLDNISINNITLNDNTDTNVGALTFNYCGGSLAVDGANLDRSSGIGTDSSAFTTGSFTKNITAVGAKKPIQIVASSNIDLSDLLLNTALGTSGGVYVSNSHNIKVEKALISGGGGMIYFENGSYDCLVQDSTIKDVTGHAFEVATSTSHDIRFLRCVAANGGTKTVTNAGIGFVVHDAKNISFDQVVAYNMVAAGITILGPATGHVYNSLFYRNGGAWASAGGVNSVRANIDIGSTEATTNFLFKNNISAYGYPSELIAPNGGTYVFAHNLYKPTSPTTQLPLNGTFSTWQALGYDNDGSSIGDTDPLFVSVPDAGDSELAATDFRLTNFSPAIGRAINVGLRIDADRHQVYPPPNIGPYGGTGAGMRLVQP